MMKKSMKSRGVAAICGFFLLCVFVFAGWSWYIASSFNLSYKKAGNFLARNIVLSAIEAACNIYDPWAKWEKTPVMGPDYSLIKNDIEKARRIEDYLRLKEHEWNIDIISVDNQKQIVSRYPFFYEQPNSRLRELREKMGLDKVVADATDELEELVLLRNWVRSRFRRIDYQKKTKNFDALEVLQNIKINNEGYESTSEHIRPCDIFPRLYVQTLLSMGFQARLCQISSQGLGHHGLTEAWSNQFNKWITMDADLNLLYMKHGIPQNLVEIHHAAQVKDKEIEIVQKIVDPEFQPQAGLEWMYDYHRYVNIADMRNDWLSRHYFPGHPRQSDRSFLGWRDNGMQLPFVFVYRPTTNNQDDFYWSLNRTEILVDSSGEPQPENEKAISLLLNTYTPNFSKFRIEVDDKSHLQEDPHYKWELHPGLNSIKVWSVNDFDRDGVVSEVKAVLH